MADVTSAPPMGARIWQTGKQKQIVSRSVPAAAREVVVMAAPAATVTMPSVVNKANFATSTTAHREFARVALRTAMIVVFQPKENWTVPPTVDHHPEVAV